MFYLFLGMSATGKNSISGSLGLPIIKSHTTREKEPKDFGDEYYYVTKEEYDTIEFLEKVEYANNFYGTSISELNKFIDSGRDCYAILNRYGCELFKERFPDQTKVIFIRVPILEARRRMEARGDTHSKINERLCYALKHGELFNHDIADLVINNTDLEESIRMTKKFIKQSRKVYMSGKIGGLSENIWRKNFRDVKNELILSGYTSGNIFDPTEATPYQDEPSWINYMRADLKELTMSDDIHLQPNWWKSRGARIEWTLANLLGLDIIYENETWYFKLLSKVVTRILRGKL